MPKANKAEVLREGEAEPIKFTDADCTAGQLEGTGIEPGDRPAEVAKAEVGEDGQLSAYDYMQLGGKTDSQLRTAQGRIKLDLRNSDDEPVDDRTQVRWVARKKTGNTRDMTGWLEVDELVVDNVENRMPLEYVTDDDGDPFLVKDGRIVSMEVRNPAVEVEVDLQNSRFKLPAVALD